MKERRRKIDAINAFVAGRKRRPGGGFEGELEKVGEGVVVQANPVFAYFIFILLNAIPQTVQYIHQSMLLRFSVHHNNEHHHFVSFLTFSSPRSFGTLSMRKGFAGEVGMRF